MITLSPDESGFFFVELDTRARGDGVLNTEHPRSLEPLDTYIYDPDNPVRARATITADNEVIIVK